MHYKNNRLAMVGDPVVGKYGKSPVAGTLVHITPGTTTCNGQVRVAFVSGLTPGSFSYYDRGANLTTDAAGKASTVTNSDVSVNLGDLLHAEDVLAEIDRAVAAAVPPVPAAS